MASTHKVEVVPVALEKHPNADALSIVRVYGYTVCVRTEDWKDRTIGAYIPPDSVVPDEPYYQFLAQGPMDPATGKPLLRDKDRRIKAKKLRGTWSQGMLVPAPPLAVIGEDVAEELGITHYEPPSPETRVTYPKGKKLYYPDQAQAPAVVAGVYDLESWYRYPSVFVDGEEVIVTEKIHGSNFRAVFHEGQLHVGSHKQWKRSDIPIIRNSRIANVLKGWANHYLGTSFALNSSKPNTDWWWTVARSYYLDTLLWNYPDYVFYGEVYGPSVQDLGYGVPGTPYASDSIRVTFYDVREGHTGLWLPYDNARRIVKGLGLEFVPELYRGPYSEAAIRSLIDGKSILSTVDQIREGIVIQAINDRFDAHCGRSKLKAVSNAYLERSKEIEVVFDEFQEATLP